MNQNELQTMYGATPESFKHRVSFALQQTEDKPVKHTMRTVLIAAAIVIALTAAAYAAFSSQVAEFFGKSYGDDTKQWLEQGEVAVAEQTLLLDGVVFTVDEVIYRNNGLYGVGTIRPEQGSDLTIIPDECEAGINIADYPYGYDVHGAGGPREQAPDGAPTYADVAKERGGKLYLVCVIPDKVGVDGGMMLTTETIGYTLPKQRDGSVRFAFEMSDATVITEGQVYSIDIWASVCEMTLDGKRLADTQKTGTWTVQIQPEPISEKTAEPAVKTTAPTQTIHDVELIVPVEYTQSGTMPVYAAIPRDFGADLNPVLFNQSGIAKTENSLITFHDEAQLDWSPESLFYNEYKGTYNGNYREPDREPMTLPLPTLSHVASDLAGHVYSGWLENWEGITLTNTALAGIMLDDAKAQVETLLTTLGVEGYICDYVLDMDVARIRSMGEQWNGIVEDNQWNAAMLNYSQVTSENEGFYLHYANGIKTDGNRFDFHAYVTQNGIADMQLRQPYTRGDVVFTPETLVSPESVMDQLDKKIADSRFSDMMLDHIISIELVYSPARAADKTGGMVLTPAWYVVYQDGEGAKDGYERYAIFNAVDGAALYTMFQ